MFREFAGLLKRVSAAAGVASLVAFAGQASAVTYVGSWDPAFGSAFPNLGWRGEAVFEIPNECLDTNGVYINTNPFSTNPSGCADSGGLSITSAMVEFYNTNSPPADGSPIGQNVTGVLDTLYFVAPSLTVTMEVRDNELYGVIGSFLTAETSNISLITAMGRSGASASFELFFRDLPLGGSLTDGPGTADYYAQMRWTQTRTCTVWGYSFACEKSGFSSIEDQIGGSSFLSFQRVAEIPEPGSLALLLPAIGMLAAFRRRKSAPAA